MTRTCVSAIDRRLDLDERRERIRRWLLRDRHGSPEGLRYENSDARNRSAGLQPADCCALRFDPPARPGPPDLPALPPCLT